MLEKWNELLDTGYIFFRDLSKQIGVKENMTKMKNIDFINKSLEYLESNENTSEFYKLVMNSSNFNTCKFNYNKEVYTLEYGQRRQITFGLFLLSYFIIKGGLRKSIKLYIQSSLLLCRENFDLRNYKLNQRKNI
jgi:hypothetical protein